MPSDRVTSLAAVSRSVVMCSQWIVHDDIFCISTFSEFVEDYAEAFSVVLTEEYNLNDGDEPGYEWEGYDGWYNNPAHPDWGGAGTFVFVYHASHSCHIIFLAAVQ